MEGVGAHLFQRHVAALNAVQAVASAHARGFGRRSMRDFQDHRATADVTVVERRRGRHRRGQPSGGFGVGVGSRAVAEHQPHFGGLNLHGEELSATWAQFARRQAAHLFQTTPRRIDKSKTLLQILASQQLYNSSEEGKHHLKRMGDPEISKTLSLSVKALLNHIQPAPRAVSSPSLPWWAPGSPRASLRCPAGAPSPPARKCARGCGARSARRGARTRCCTPARPPALRSPR